MEHYTGLCVSIKTSTSIKNEFAFTCGLKTTFMKSMKQLVQPSTPAGGVFSAHLQKVCLQLLCVVQKAVSEGVNQTCCTAFVFHQLCRVTWKHVVRRILFIL